MFPLSRVFLLPDLNISLKNHFKMIGLSILITFILSLAWFVSEKISRRKFPPGPIALPLVGHLLQLGARPHLKTIEWQKKYGPIMGIWFGSFRSIVINDGDLLRQAFKMDAFSGRPSIIMSITHSDGTPKGIAALLGRAWKEQQGFASKALRTFGLTSHKMELECHKSIKELLLDFESMAGTPIQTNTMFSTAVYNTIYFTLLGCRMNPEDAGDMEAIKSVSTIFREINVLAGIFTFMPWLNQIFPSLSSYEELYREIDFLKNHLRKTLDKRRNVYVRNQPKCFADAHFDEEAKTTDVTSTFHPAHDELIYTILDLFLAGGLPTTNVIRWTYALLLHYPHIAKTMQDEIDKVVGKDRLPTLADRPNCPYTVAVINEVMRYITVTPFGVLHSTVQDVNFNGYHIPKDTVVVPNFYAANHDKKTWGDPDIFRPERFLDHEGRYVLNERFKPFSTGKRACVGKNFANDQLFLFTASLYQAFDALPHNGLPDLDPLIGIAQQAKPFEIILRPRHV